MIIKTLEATYEKGVLQLAEPLGLAPRSRVRIRVEMPSPQEAVAGLRARIDEAYADGPDEDEALLQNHMARLRERQTEAW